MTERAIINLGHGSRNTKVLKAAKGEGVSTKMQQLIVQLYLLQLAAGFKCSIDNRFDGAVDTNADHVTRHGRPVRNV